MGDHNDLIDGLILSSNFGVGRVVGVDMMGDKEFLVVEDTVRRIKNFVSANDTNSYRRVSDKKTLGDLVAGIGTKKVAHEYETKKDRINHFKTQSKIQEIASIVDLVLELNQLEDRGAAEDQIMQRLMDSIALEYSLVMEIELEQANKFIKDSLSGGSNGE